MQQTSGWMLYDPFKVERVALTANGPVEWGFVELKMRDLIAQIFKRNYDAGHRGEELFRVCAIHRSRPEIHRWFNLNCTLRTGPRETDPIRVIAAKDGSSVEIRSFGQEYGGAFNHATSLLDGSWRIGSIEEENERKARDEADAAKVKASRERDKHPETVVKLPERFVPELAEALTKHEEKKG